MLKQRLAFTLVEILVVLGVVMLLAALLFPVFGRVRENGRVATCLSNQKQILLALQLYQDDAAGYFPFRDPFDFPNQIWIDALLAYAKTPQVFVCPSDVEVENTKKFGFVSAPDGSRFPSIPASYIANEELQWDWPWFFKNARFRPRALADVVHPASTIFLGDGAKEASPLPPYWTEPRVTGSSSVNSLAISRYSLRDPSQSNDGGIYTEIVAPNPRHNGRAVVGFVDGHVKSLDLAKWYFPNSPYLDPTRGG